MAIGRRFFAWGRGALNLALIAYALLLAGVILYYHPVRVDCTAKAVHTLSDETRTALANLKDPVRVIVSYGDPDPSKRRVMGRVFQEAQDFLREYAHASARIEVLDSIDVFQRQEAWKQAKTRFNLTDYNRVTFITGAKQQDVRVEDMADVRYGQPGAPPSLESLHVERAFTAALRRLQSAPRKAYLLVNDGIEGQVGPDLKSAKAGGLHSLVVELRANNYDLATLDIVRDGKVPADCDVLLAVGLVGPLPNEVPEVMAYLHRGGRLFMALNPQYSTRGLDFLEDWGISVMPAWVVAESKVAGTSVQTEHVYVTEFDPMHPITRKFEKDRFRMLMTYARPLGAVKSEVGESGPLVGVKAPNVWGERKAGSMDRPWVCDAGDFPSTPHGLSTGRVIEAKLPDGKVARLVVFGTWTFLGNEQLHSYDHASVLHNSLWWLLGQEEQAGVRAPEIVERSIGLDVEGKVMATLMWALLAAVPGCGVIAGLVAMFVRRK